MPEADRVSGLRLVALQSTVDSSKNRGLSPLEPTPRVIAAGVSLE